MDKEKIDVTQLKALYEKVFDENGNVTLCGRENCVELINICEQLSGEVCGNKTRGYMYTDKIKEVYKKYTDIHSKYIGE